MPPGLAPHTVASHRPMRHLILALALVALAPPAAACSCFSPELRIKTGRETLQLAQVAAFGTVVAMAADGAARIEVIESFKGPARGAIVTMHPGTGTCTAALPPVGRQVLVIGFDQGLDACHRYPPDHFLLEAFRHIAVTPP